MSMVSVPTEQVRVYMTGGPMGSQGQPGPPGPGGASYIPVSSVAVSNVALTGLQTIDGVAGAANQRVLLTNQGIGSQNGIWLQQVGAWTRPSDYATTSIVAAFLVAVLKGGLSFGDSIWALQTVGAVVDTTATVWSEIANQYITNPANPPLVGANPKPPFWQIPFRGTLTSDGFGNKILPFNGAFPNGVLDVGVGLEFASGSYPTWFLAPWAWSLSTVTIALVNMNGSGPIAGTPFKYRGLATGW